MGLSVDVELIISEERVIHAKSQNMSDGGVFLMTDDNALPLVGTEVKLRLKNQMGDGEDPPIISAIIVRQSTMGIGLEFIN